MSERRDLPNEIARRFDAGALARDPASIAVLSPDGVILWVNEAWCSFAADNGGQGDTSTFGLGLRYADAVQGELRTWFDEHLHKCQETHQPFELDYECSSPDTFRKFRLRVLPVEGYVLMSHALTAEQPHTRTEMPPDDAAYRAPSGLTTQCSNCRRFRRLDGGAWDWVPAWVERPPARVSHGICAVCIGFYYGDLLAEPDANGA